MNDLARRAFLKRVALAAAAAAAAALKPGISFGEMATDRTDTPEDLDWKKTPCRFCGVGCGLLVGIEGGRAVAVKGDPGSPVNKGLACVKGYHAVQALYGRDRLTRAMVRRNGRLVQVPLREALDLVARTMRDTLTRHGKDSVALYGSGQWTIPAGYVASKLMKGAIGTNNLDSDGRLGLATALAGARASLGEELPPGCYEDLDHADVFVLWGSNMAETFPVLFSRMLERRQRDPNLRIIDVATRTTRTSYAADRSLLFTPRTEVALANAICHELVSRRWVNRDFIAKHVAFKTGATGIEPARSGAELASDPGSEATWDEYVRFLSQYAPGRVQQITGISAADIRWLASVYGDRSRKVMSLWSAGLNQHARGIWSNNVLYNIHLLTGKIASPGNGPFALTGPPSGAGTVQGVGTLVERLPRGEVTNQEDRRRAARIWNVPEEQVDRRPGPHALALFQAYDQGTIRFLWVQGSNPLVMLPNLGRYRQATGKADRFLVVSDTYPTPTTDLADVVLPSALWIEQEGLYGNGERRTQHWDRMVSPPGEATSDAWQLIEVARRLGHQALFPWDQAGHVEAVWAEYARFHDGTGSPLVPLSLLKARPGAISPWRNDQETKWRFNTVHDPAADRSRGDFDFYGHPDHRAWIWLRPGNNPGESPDQAYPFWLVTGRVLEHWDAGSLTRRIPALHRAVPRAYAEMHREDARALGIRNGDDVRLVSRRGALVIPVRIDYRAQPPRGQIFVPLFDESLPVNLLTNDTWCPISGQPDGKTGAVRVERLGRLGG